MSRGSMGAALLVCALVSTAGRAAECTGSSAADFPVRFPPHLYVFEGVVIDPAVPVEIADTATSAGRWAVEVEVVSSAHLPESRRRFELLPSALSLDCTARPLSDVELTELLRPGDRLRILGRALPGPPAGRLGVDVPRGLAVLAGDDPTPTLRTIDSHYEYALALLELDRRELDIERFALLLAIGKFVDDGDQYAAIVNANIAEKRLRRQLKKMHPK